MSGGYTAVLTGRATNSGVGFADLVTDANAQREIQKMRAEDIPQPAIISSDQGTHVMSNSQRKE